MGSAESSPQTAPSPSPTPEGNSSNTGEEYTDGVPANIYINWDLSPEALEKQHQIEETAEDIGDTATKQTVEVQASATEDDIGDDETPAPEEPTLEPGPPDTEAGAGSGGEEPPEPPEGPPSPPEGEDSQEDAEHSEALAERDPVRIMLPGDRIEAALDPTTDKGWMILLLRTKNGKREAVVGRVTGKDGDGDYKIDQHEIVDLAELTEFQIIPTAEEGKPVFSSGEPVKVARPSGEVEEGFNPKTGEGWFAVTEYFKNGQRYVRVRKATVDDQGEKVYERKDVRYEDLLGLQNSAESSAEGGSTTEAETGANGGGEEPSEPPDDADENPDASAADPTAASAIPERVLRHAERLGIPIELLESARNNPATARYLRRNGIDWGAATPPKQNRPRRISPDAVRAAEQLHGVILSDDFIDLAHRSPRAADFLRLYGLDTGLDGPPVPDPVIGLQTDRIKIQKEENKINTLIETDPQWLRKQIHMPGEIPFGLGHLPLVGDRLENIGLHSIPLVGKALTQRILALKMSRHEKDVRVKKLEALQERSDELASRLASGVALDDDESTELRTLPGKILNAGSKEKNDGFWGFGWPRYKIMLHEVEGLHEFLASQKRELSPLRIHDYQGDDRATARRDLATLIYDGVRRSEAAKKLHILPDDIYVHNNPDDPSNPGFKQVNKPYQELVKQGKIK